MKVYNSKNFNIEYKIDKTPVTLADKKSHDLILKNLTRLYPKIPVISEEGTAEKYELNKKSKYYWLVDPLDGTEEFIKKKGEFTVNISLIQNNKAALVIIYVSTEETLYYGMDKFGSFKIEKNGIKKNYN